MSVKTVKIEPSNAVHATMNLIPKSSFPMIGKYIGDDFPDARGNIKAIGFIVLFLDSSGSGVVLESNDPKYRVGVKDSFILSNFRIYDAPITIQNSNATNCGETD